MRLVLRGILLIGLYLLMSVAPLLVALIGPHPTGKGFWIEFSMVVNAFHMLSRSEPYRELRAHYFDETRQRQQLVGWLARRIEHMGYHVHPEPLSTTRS